MSNTSTVTASEHSLSSSATLGSSIGSINLSRRPHSVFSKTYKQASTFYLTRRFSDALSTLQPLITTPSPDQHEHGDDADNGRAPIAKADKKWRVKIWSFYLTLLNSIADLGYEEGQGTFGAQAWKGLVAQVEDGHIWDDVAQIGYNGDETKMDAEVVVNLANLLLAQSPNQKSNQAHLETYLTVTGPFEGASNQGVSARESLNGSTSEEMTHSLSSDPLKDLEIHLQLVEIFALHILPRNEEWTYAQSFIESNDSLDEERKEGFLQALHDLQHGDEDLDAPEVSPPSLSAIEPSLSQPGKLDRTDSNITVVPASSRPKQMISTQASQTDQRQTAPEITGLRPVSPKPTPESANVVSEPPIFDRQSQSDAAQAPTRDRNKSTIARRGVFLFTVLQTVVSNISQHFSQNPVLLFRSVLFVIFFLTALSRRDLRERFRRILGRSFERVKQTLGMGVKVSYL